MISVIIPTLNEEDNIGTCIEAILNEGYQCEIIVADGGSKDKTAEYTKKYQGVSFIQTPQGRGIQMNTGASIASGDVLLFLHADTTLEKGWPQSIYESLVLNPSIVGGAFILAVDNPAIKYRLVEAWVLMRSTHCKLPYGDQAIFIRRDFFRKLEGYRNIPLMEDVDLIERMKEIGQIAILEKKAFTSVRRWRKKGLIRTAAINQITMMLYKFGVSPEKLFRLYYR